MVDRDKTKNVCKYWATIEPGVCSYWSSTLTKCTFEGTSIDSAGNNTPRKASRYPYCNLIGTAETCSDYNGTGTERRCVLPDPFRHVCNRRTGEKWVVLETPEQLDEEGAVSTPAVWTFDDINVYNSGACDGAGTATTCSGYSTQHLGFGRLKPEPIPDDLQARLDEPWTGFKTEEELGYRLPLSFDVWNARAQLSRCYWWAGDPEEFSINESMGYINSIPFKCVSTDEITDQFQNHRFDPIGRYIPPCNGAHDECPRYTGVCWQYCIVDKMQEGDKILAEQILELRYHLRKETWDSDVYTKSFIHPHIFSWTGSDGIHYSFTSDGSIDPDTTIIDTIETYQENFEYLDISYKEVPLSQGTPAQYGKYMYPTLVEEVKDLYLRPIIRNVFDTDENGDNAFEVTDFDQEEVLILGDVFWYNTTTYGINLNDPEIIEVMPSRDILLEYDSMDDIEASLGDIFNGFYNKLNYFLTNLIAYAPEKMIVSELGSIENMFYIPMTAFFGENNILVLNKGSGRWEFDKIKVVKKLCGGVIGQTRFELLGNGAIDRLPWYENNFYAQSNNNGLIQFGFFTFGGDNVSQNANAVSYVYNDHFTDVIELDPLNPTDGTTYHQSYRLYKVTAYSTVIMSDSNMKFLGNAGYILLIIPDADKKLSNIHRPWETDSSIYLNVIDTNGDTQSIEMEVYEKGTPRLEVNQIIIRPKNTTDFSQPCSATITFSKIYVYEKRSFGETPTADEYVEVADQTLGDDDVLTHWGEEIELTEESGTYSLKKFNNEPMFISVVYKGENGRIKGITRTKMLTWVRQPFCKDVEIYYAWAADYEEYVLQPEMDCYWDLKKDGNRRKGRAQKYYSPPCGDHDYPNWGSSAPMWYPYNECPSSANYNIVTQFTENDITTIEQFDGEHGVHGSFDMRMMGPDDKYGYTCDNHARLPNCSCDWSFCNQEKISANIFVGYARYRGGLTAVDVAKCTKEGGEMPKFGNVYRNFLRSYRSMDHIYYYRIDGTNIERTDKWVPMYEMYSKSNVTEGIDDYPFKLYTKDYDSPFIHQGGLLIANNSIEGVDIGETIDYTNRFRFEDVMEAKSTTQGILYPYPRNPYNVGSSNTLISWFKYKDYKLDPTKSIHWVWQEIWRVLERYSLLLSNFLTDENYEAEQEAAGGPVYNVPYQTTEENGVVGRHMFLDIDHPTYLYNAELKEHRAVCEEGEHEIKIVPCELNNENKVYFLMLLDNGPFRIFDLDGNWATTNPNVVFGDAYDGFVDDYIALYESCSDSVWDQDVTLYEEGTPITTTVATSKAAARSDERALGLYDDVGDAIENFYQRGLNIVLNSSLFSRLPYKVIEYDKVVDFSMNNPPNTGQYSIMNADEFYPYTTLVGGILYDVDDESNNIIFDFVPNDDDESIKRVITKVKITFNIGAVQPVEYDENFPDIWAGELYHRPELDIYKGDTLTSFSSLYNETNMILSTREDGSPSFYEVEYDLDFEIGDLENAYRFLKLSFRFNPTDDEIDEAGVTSYSAVCTHSVKIESINLYTMELIEATEIINTYERKYNASYGTYGDVPPHGTDSTGSLLYPISGDGSTVYQDDYLHGVIGLDNSDGELTTMNKCRGRLMDAVIEDKRQIPGGNVYDWEAEQKKVHDATAISQGNTTIVLKGSLPPDLKRRLSELNIKVPDWEGRSCNFLSTIVRPLASMLVKDTYSPCGHEFFHDADTLNLDEVERCGYGQWRYDVFDYAWRNFCTGSQYGTQLDVLDVYAKGVIGVLYGREMFQKFSVRYTPETESARTTAEITSLAMPINVKPFI